MRKFEGFPMEELEEMRESLYTQLEQGYDWIEARAGQDTREAEEFWADLKRSYDDVVEEIRHKIGEGL